MVNIKKEITFRDDEADFVCFAKFIKRCPLMRVRRVSASLFSSDDGERELTAVFVSPSNPNR